MDITKLKEQLRASALGAGAVIRGQSFGDVAAAALAEIERLESALADCKRGGKSKPGTTQRGV